MSAKLNGRSVARVRQDARVHAPAAAELQRFGRGQGLLVQHQHAGRQPGGAGHQQFRALPLEPAGQPDVVGVVVRHEEPGDGVAAEGAGAEGLDDGAGALRVETDVDHRPAGILAQEVDVDVIQRHRQRQPRPEDAMGNFDRLPLGRRMGPGEGQAGVAVRNCVAGHGVEPQAAITSVETA